jgi:hypothetical protein
VAFGRIDLNDFLKDVGNGQTNATTMDAEVEYFRNTLELSNTKGARIDGAARRDRSDGSG